MKKVTTLLSIYMIISFIACKTSSKVAGRDGVIVANKGDTSALGVVDKPASKVSDTSGTIYLKFDTSTFYRRKNHSIVSDSQSVIDANRDYTVVNGVPVKFISRDTDSEGTIITNYGDSTIVGIAREGIGGPHLIAGTHPPCFLGGVSEWPRGVYGKKVRARGRYITIDQRERFRIYPLAQGYAFQFILKEAKWEVVE